MNEEKIEEDRKKEKKNPTWNEIIYGREHKLTPRIKRFCFLFVSQGEKKTIGDFAKHFKVHASTIATWLSYPQVKEEINRLLESQEERLMELLESKLERVINGLLEMFLDKKTPAEVRRKIGYNLLSFAKLNDVNTGGRTIINQQQATTVNPYENMSDEDLDRALAEMDELENG